MLIYFVNLRYRKYIFPNNPPVAPVPSSGSTPTGPLRYTPMYVATLALVLCAAVVEVRALPSRYFCSTFPAAASGGASGTFAIKVDDATATYGIYMSFAGFVATCDPRTTNLNYHIHTNWGNTTSDVALGSGCGPALTGGHYDPTIQCTAASQYINTLCPALNRTSANYNCTPALYSAGYFDQCEVGDLSAKNGPLSLTQSNVWTDVRPLSVVEYGNGKWKSVVFHCGSPRVLCGNLVEVGSWRQCTGVDLPTTAEPTTTTTVSTDRKSVV